jgi:hypothetical protein
VRTNCADIRGFPTDSRGNWPITRPL